MDLDTPGSGFKEIINMTRLSKKYFDRSQSVSPGGVHSPVRAFRGVGGNPIFIKSANKSVLTDVDNKNYIDFCMSWGPLIFGHQNPEIKEVIYSSLDKGWTYGTAEPYSLELAELITNNIPWVEKVRFVNSGTEAVMSALRVAKAATKKNKIIKFDGCYHGHTDSMLVKAGSGLAEMPSPDSAGVSEKTASETIVVPLDNLEALERAFENNINEIAAIIIEPIPANNGLLIQKNNFLKSVRTLCTKYNSLLIFDEVITGFRVDFGGMAKLSEVEPDLVTYGKVIGGGFPVGAYGGKSEYMDLVAPSGPVYQAGTLSANPVAMSAGIATLKKLLNDSPYQSLNEKTQRLKYSIESNFQNSSIPLHVQSFGSLFWVVFGEINTKDQVIRNPNDTPKMHTEVFQFLFNKLIEKGLYLAPSAYEVGFISTSHTKDELEFLGTTISEVLNQYDG